jgi:hypothetical protein
MPRAKEVPLESPATMALRSKTWTIVLRCYECNRRFAVKMVPLDRIASVAEVTPCPHCATHAVVAAAGGSAGNKLHRILDLRQD